MHYLLKDLYFPPVTEADRHGLLAVGGDLSPERLMLAYRSGIFPWFQEEEPILWWAPRQRMVLFFDELKVSKSMRNVLNRNLFSVTFDRDFESVIRNCSTIARKGQEGTWISREMIEAYLELHRRGFARSVEVWQEGTLVGGLYGVDLGHIFCGESMFSRVPNASKTAFITLARKLSSEGYALIDGQLHNDYLESLGCREIPRVDFMRILGSATPG
jgi:leucyl/phenylalanyl-tRNA---protein transferase